MASWQLPVLPWPVVVSALAGVLLVLTPRGLPGRYWGLLGLLPLLLYTPQRPALGEAWFTLLDVGHGLAAVVRTRTHTLVFDTGPRYGDRFDAGSTAIVPFLRYHGIDRVDRLVISHGDSDHVGGLRSLRQALPVVDIFSGVAERVDGARPCQSGQHWRWDGVQFNLLHPQPGVRWPDNDGSCVLRVASGGGSVLIPGDIEVAGEDALLSSARTLLASDVLVAAHHGSRSSSQASFIDAVDPSLVLIPSGYRDRYGHPHAEVVARFATRAITVLSTAQVGAITVRLPASGPIVGPCVQRARVRHFWQWRPPAEKRLLGMADCRDDAE